jgi:SIR2-like protein
MSARPETYRRQLMAALSNRDVPLGFLIGAGCGASVLVSDQPLIPPIARLSQLVCARLRTRQQERMSVLERQFGAPTELSSPNVEELLSRVRALSEVARDEAVFGLTLKDLKALEKAISTAIVENVSAELPVGRSSYSQFARWAASFDRRTPLELFTTNYDLLMEQAFERIHWPFFDGFVGSARPFFDLTAIDIDIVPVRWVRLWKVHGSVNWRLSSDHWVIKSREGKNLLIYPSHLKYAESRRMPYLAIRDRLRNFFRANPAAFITCGYSFADQHLNEDITFGLQSNRGAICFALLYGKLSDYANARTMASLHPNMILLASDKVVSRTRELEWDEEETFDLGDFARFADFLVIDVMGRDDHDAT